MFNNLLKNKKNSQHNKIDDIIKANEKVRESLQKNLKESVDRAIVTFQTDSKRLTTLTTRED